MDKQLTRYEEILLNLEDQVRFYINTPERAGEALTFVKKLKEFAASVEDKVKDRSKEIMRDKNLREIVVDEYIIKLVDPSISNVYKPSSLINALGLEMAMPFLEVKGALFEKWVIKSRLDLSIYEKCKIGITSKTRSGYIAVKPKSDK